MPFILNNVRTDIELPTEIEAEEAKIASRNLSKYSNEERLHIKIYKSSNEVDDLVLPGYALDIILDILVEVSNGNAIGIIPIHTELTTQEAADILNVSRPYLVSLLEDKKIPFRKVGTHRRVLAKDLLDYKKEANKECLKALEELTDLSQECDMGY